MIYINLFVIIIAVLVFGMLILIHEVGHFSAARIFHVPVVEFAIGMGPKIFSKVSSKSKTVYSLRLFPIGGYVSMVGEDASSDDVNALTKKPVWQRAVIVSAGSITNLVIGIIVMSFLVIGAKNLPSTTIHKFADENAVTYQSGLRVDDKILKINNTSVHIANDLVYEIMRNAIEPVDVTVLRNGEKIVLNDVVFPTIVEKGTLFGNADFYVKSESKNIMSVLKHSFFRSFSTIKMIWESFFDLFTGRYGLEQVSGPIGVTEAIGEAAKSSMPDLIYISVVISMNLGIMNLLPLPALDGGRLLFLIIEVLRGKPVKPEIEGYVHFAGIVVLMGLMIVIAFKDIFTLFG